MKGKDTGAKEVNEQFGRRLMYLTIRHQEPAISSNIRSNLRLHHCLYIERRGKPATRSRGHAASDGINDDPYGKFAVQSL